MFIEINGHLLNVVSFGAGTPNFLAVGGWVGSWEVWQQPIELLSKRWRCASYDHRGAGVSAVRAEDISPEGLVEDVFGVMDALEIDRCILAGESLGAVAVLEAAAQSPERFLGIVLVDGAPAVHEPSVRALIDGARKNYEATLSAFVDQCTPEPNVEHLRLWGRHILRRATSEAAARIFECYLERAAPPPKLDRIDMPALVIHGTADAIVPLSTGEWMVKSLPKANFVKFVGAGHVPTLTRPREVAEAIQHWFKKYIET